MNLQSIATAAFNAVATVTDSLWGNASYKQAGTVGYNTGTGVVSPNTGTTSVRVLLCKYRAEDKPALREGHLRMLMKRSALSAITPSQSDYVEQGGVTWEVVEIEDDPTQSHWALVVKRLQK